MPDWHKPMQQTFEYYTVDPGTWKDDKKLTTVKSCSINRDSDTETLGSATIDVNETLDECYVRVYLVTIQNGVTERYPLGTFLVQTPSSNFTGKIREATLDAYTPLLELKESPPPLGYHIPEGSNIMNMAYLLVREHARAPVVKTTCESTLNNNFVSNVDDTWITFLSDLIANAKYSFGLDELGRIIFMPEQDIASLQPVWTFNDDDESILYPEISTDNDLYGIPNVVEVVYSNGKYSYYSRVVNDDENSPTSTVNRGREIVYRDTSPSLSGIPSQAQLDEYAEQLLKALSSIECTVRYSHGYCPVRLGDCVRLNYVGAGLVGVKAKVISQTIDCSTSCKVTETAVFTNKLWR